MNGNIFVEYQMNNRVMRKTNNKELLDSIYSKKYNNWIKKFLNKNKIEEVPLLIICNTLYKLPDTFRIQDHSFFIGDFYLFDYFYDWNYVLSNDAFDEYVVNLCIKQYIESSYLHNDVDVAYWLAKTSPILETYKDEQYTNEKAMTLWVEKTQIQEAFALLHEASHYLVKYIDRKEAFADIANVHARLEEVVRERVFILEKEKDPKVEDKLFEECFCDSEAIKYMLDQYDSENPISRQEYFSLLYKMLLYLYILGYIDAIAKAKFNPEEYYDYQLFELSYRMGNIYRTLREYLLNHGVGEEMEIHETVYRKQMILLKEKMDEIRRIIAFIRELIAENERDFQIIAQIDEQEKMRYLKEYLALY